MFSHIIRRCSRLARRASLRRFEPTSSLITCDMHEKIKFCLVSHCHNTVRNIHQDSDACSPDETKLNQNHEQQLLEFRQASPENEKRFKTLKLEVDVLRHDGEKVPNNVQPRHWITLLELTSTRKRRKYLQYLWQKEIYEVKDKIKREKKKEITLERNLQKRMEDTGALKYGLQDNHMFLRIQDSTMKNFYNQKLITSMLFEPKIVFDCSYNVMTAQESMSCAKQLMYAFASNRIHKQPFDLHLCNVYNSDKLTQCLLQLIPTLFNSEYPMNVTEKSYLDIFKKEDLVYLTPHCNREMEDYNPDAVYIIGAFVDKTHPKPVSLAKAKKEGLRMEKLPLDRYLHWGSGSGKNLTVNQVFQILLDYKATKDWTVALKHVPTRKLQSAREKLLQRKMQSLVDTLKKETVTSGQETSIYYKTENKEFIQNQVKEQKKQDFSFEARKQMQNLFKE